MKIDKNKLSKALKQIGIFVGKNIVNQNASLVHFKNKDNKAMIFATDFASAGRAYFETEEVDEFEFCIEYNQLVQVKKIRDKEINVEIFQDRINENGAKESGIEFYDNKTKFTWALHNPAELIGIETATIIPEVPYFEINAKTFKNALKEAGYARNEKETQTLYITGVNFITDGSMVSMASTDRHRIASWKSKQEVIEEMDSVEMSGILSPKTVQSVSLFDDDEMIKIYIEESKIVLVSDSLEAYATKIQCAYPDISKFFDKSILSSYSIQSKDVVESLSIIEGINTKSLRLEFSENQVKITAKSDNGDNVVDYFACNRVTGNDEDIWLDPALFMDIFKNIDNDNMIIEFRDTGNNFKILSYVSDDGAYGMLAPQRK
jgi:DNA polymerase III sliding clamp (beta) subunit (PCNA family)